MKTNWGKETLKKELLGATEAVKSSERKLNLQEVNTPMEISSVMNEMAFQESENIDDIFIDNCAGDGNLTIPIYINKLDMLLNIFNTEDLDKSEKIKKLVLTLGSVYGLEYDKSNLISLKKRIKNLVALFMQYTNLDTEPIVKLINTIIDRNTLQSDSLSYTNPETNEHYSILQYSDEPFAVNGVSRRAIAYAENYLFIVKTQINTISDDYAPHMELVWDINNLEKITERIKKF